MLYSQNMGGVEIFRPRKDIEEEVYNKVKKKVFNNFSSGIYTDKEIIKNIVNFLQKEYNEILNEYLPKIRGLDFIPFLIGQYEAYGKVSELYKENKISHDDRNYWENAPCFTRRGIKYLLERLCLNVSSHCKHTHSIEIQEDAISRIFISVEELVSMYMRNQDYINVQDDVTLRLNENVYRYFEIEHELGERQDNYKHMNAMVKYVPQPMFLHDYEAHGEFLNENFKKALGLSYTEVLAVLQWVVVTYSSEDNPEEIGSFKWDAIIEKLSGHYKITPLQAEIILNGFTLTPQTLTDRKIYLPKQEYRAYKRAFFKHQIDDIKYVFFSRRMAMESLSILVHDVPFRKLPSEWKAPAVLTALDGLSNRAGSWFENVVKDNLIKVGLTGSTSVKSLIVEGKRNLKFPADIGEIDFIGFDENQGLLVVIEMKQVGQASEPRMHQDDLSKFVIGEKSYSNKFRKKYAWVINNIDAVIKHFQHNFNLSTEIKTIGYAMITLYPTIASERISDFSCVSIGEFMSRYTVAKSWPFSSVPNTRNRAL